MANEKSKGLTPEQKELFNKIKTKLQRAVATAYVSSGMDNKTQSYLSACKSIGKKPAKVPEASASEILNLPEVRAFTEACSRVAAERAQVNADYILQSLHDMDQMDVLDILNEDGSIKSISEWPKVWRQAIAGFEVAEMYEGQGKDREQIGLLKKIKWVDKLKVKEMLGKHVKVNAFKEVVETKVTIEEMPDDALDRRIAALINNSKG